MSLWSIWSLLLACHPRDPAPPSSTNSTSPDGCERDTLGPLSVLPLDDIRLDEPPWIDPMAGAGVGAGDLDGDGLLDLVVPQRGPDQLLLQTEDGDFVDATEALWPEVRDEFSAAAHLVDIDGDDDLDVFVCHNENPGWFEDAPNRLFLNDGSGQLRDVSEDWGVEQMVRPCYGASFADIDGDDDLDVALANYDPCDTPESCARILEWPSPQILWEQTPDGFVDISDRLGERARSALPHLATLIDVDGDLDVDLYLVNDNRGDIAFSEPGLLYRNDGTGQMTLAPASLGAEIPLEAMGLGVGDLNSDLKMDMVIPGVRRFAMLLSLPDEDGWYDGATAAGLVVAEDSERHYGWGTELADLDNDGDLDVPAVFGYLLGEPGDGNPDEQPDAIYLNDGAGQLSQVAEDWGFADRGIARGLLVADLDGDGWLDLIKRELGGPTLGYRANCGTASWLTVALRQPGANTRAIGAVVTLEAGGETQRRWVHLGGTGMASSGDGTVHFGLDSAEQVERLVVTWPDGEETTLEDVAARQHLRIARP